MMRRLLFGFAVAAIAAALWACSTEPPAQPASPSATTAATSSSTVTIETFTGQWGTATSDGTSSDLGVPENSAVTLVANGVCSLLAFNVEKNADNATAAIVFAATCANARIRGTGTGRVSDGVLSWRAQGTLQLASGRACAFAFTEGNSATPAGQGLIKVVYNGTICGHPVSGTQVVRRK